MMRIVLREAAHAQQTMQHAAALLTVNRTHFRQAHGQVAVGTDATFIDVQVEWAVHWF